MRIALLVAFVCSGGAGLIYELAWSRYTTLFVGHSAEAQVLVIGMFLGGMSVGALVTAQRSSRLRNPLLVYAGVELALAVVGVGYHGAFQIATNLAYDSIFPALPAGPAISLAKWVLASAGVFLPSVLLGATFPLMAAGVMRAFPGKPGGTISALYFANSFGGAIAILVAGFLLISSTGLAGTSASGAVLNVLAASAAFFVSRRVATEPEMEKESAPVTNGGEIADAPSGLWRLLLVVSALTAVASFIYEIGWIRMLSLVMGSATHSFELMLSAFVLGLALGALLIRRQGDRTARPLALLGNIQWAMGMCALATLPLYVASFGWMADLVSGLPPTDTGYRVFNLARYCVALIVMFPATALAGMTLPIITTTLLRAGAGERSIGWVYAVNTGGAIAGVMLAGLVLMPMIGLKGMLIAGAGLDIALGIGLLVAHARSVAASPSTDSLDASRSPRPRILVLGTLAALALAWTGVGLRFDRALLTSGVYRYGQVDADGPPILYYADGRTASVGVHVDGADTLIVMTSNGKPDASLTARWIRAASEDVEPAQIEQQDESTQLLGGLVTAMHANGGRAAVIGHGSGMSSHFVLADPTIESLVTIEIEPRMVDASYVYYPANARVFDDPRSRIVIADAKSFFASGGDQYDLILSVPSNPWVSGIASLFSQEFYERIRAYLTPDGVFGQWLHFYEMSDELITNVLVALHDNFPAYRGYLIGDSDLLIVATLASELPTPDWGLLERSALQSELDHVPPIRPHHLDGLKVFERDELAPLLGGRSDGNSDFRPLLDLGAERARYRNAFAHGLAGLTEDRFRVAAALGEWRLDPAPEAGAPIAGIRPLVDRARGAEAREQYRVTDAARADLDRAGIPISGRPRYGLPAVPSDSTDRAGWATWLGGFLASEARFHGGTAGYADTAFYASVREQLATGSGPALTEAAVDLWEGLASWDFDEALRGAKAILGALPEADASDALWDPPEVLRALAPASLLDGAVVAGLRTGDVEFAAEAYRRLAPLVDRPSSDFRMQLLRAHIEATRP